MWRFWKQHSKGLAQRRRTNAAHAERRQYSSAMPARSPLYPPWICSRVHLSYIRTCIRSKARPSCACRWLRDIGRSTTRTISCQVFSTFSCYVQYFTNFEGSSIKTLWLDGPCRTTRPRNKRSGVRHSQAYKSHALTHDEGPADRHCFHGREAFVASRTHPCFRLTALHVRVHMLTYGSGGPVPLHDKASLVPSILRLLAAHRLGTHEIVARIKQLVLMTGTLRTWCSRMGGLFASVELSSTQKAKNVVAMKHAGL